MISQLILSKGYRCPIFKHQNRKDCISGSIFASLGLSRFCTESIFANLRLDGSVVKNAGRALDDRNLDVENDDLGSEIKSRKIFSQAYNQLKNERNIRSLNFFG